MTEPFELPILFNGEKMSFDAQLLPYGYVHKFKVNVNGEEVTFEPDEERNYRAIVDPQTGNNMKQSEIDLLRKIAEALQCL